MSAKRNSIPDIVRNTLEYNEARILLVERDAVRAKAARINAELKQLQRLSAAAVELAKSDVQATQSAEADPTDQPLSLSTEAREDKRPENPENQPSDEPATEQLDTLLAVFLATINRNLAWEKLNALVTPAYSKGAWPAPRISVSSMIRLYFLQQWCCLPNEAIAQKMQNCPAVSTFVGIDHQALPSPSTLLRFKSMLEQNGLTEQIAQIVIDELTFKDKPSLVEINPPRDPGRQRE